MKGEQGAGALQSSPVPGKTAGKICLALFLELVMTVILHMLLLGVC